MRSSFDKAIFAENVQAGLLGCAEGAKKNTTNSKVIRVCIKHLGAREHQVCKFQNVVLQDASAAGGRNADITVIGFYILPDNGKYMKQHKILVFYRSRAA